MAQDLKQSQGEEVDYVTWGKSLLRSARSSHVFCAIMSAVKRSRRQLPGERGGEGSCVGRLLSMFLQLLLLQH